MLAYIARRLLLIIPTLFGIMVVNFVIVQAAPGGPVELMIARIKGTAVEATARVGSAGGGTPGPARAAPRNARRGPGRGSQPTPPALELSRNPPAALLPLVPD